jgi:hypothetical protein
MAKLEQMHVDYYCVPLPTPVEASAAGLMKAFDMVAVFVTDSEGANGVGYTVMHEGQGAAPHCRSRSLPWTSPFGT